MRRKTDPFTIGGIGHHTPCLPENGEGVMRSLQHGIQRSVTDYVIYRKCNWYNTSISWLHAYFFSGIEPQEPDQSKSIEKSY